MNPEILTKILRHQAALMGKFREIESANGFNFPSWPIDPASMKGQHEIRRLAWCIQEELCECANAYDEESPFAAKTELMDAMHFIAEMMLTLGYWPDDIKPVSLRFMNQTLTGTPHGCLYVTMTNLGRCINFMKSKPWKQNLKPFDETVFKTRFSSFFHSFILTCYTFGMNDDLIEHMYFGKAKENQQRIDAGV